MMDNMMEIVVYLTDDYSQNEIIWVSHGTTRDEIIKIINSQLKEWYSFDIIK